MGFITPVLTPLTSHSFLTVPNALQDPNALLFSHPSTYPIITETTWIIGWTHNHHNFTINLNVYMGYCPSLLNTIGVLFYAITYATKLAYRKLLTNEPIKHRKRLETRCHCLLCFNTTFFFASSYVCISSRVRFHVNRDCLIVQEFDGQWHGLGGGRG